MKKLFWALFILIIIAAGILVGSFYIAATSWHSKAEVEVSVPKGASVRSIANEMYSKGAIGTPRLFELYVRFKALGGDLKAGTYDFPKGMTMMTALDMLVKGDVRQYEFTIIEGWTIKDIAAALKGKPFLGDEAGPDEFLGLTRNKDFMKKLGIEGVPSLEGFLYPDTYKVGYPLDMRPFITRLVSRFFDVWKGLLKEFGKEGVEIDTDEVVTLASIVEKETGAPAERMLIAGVFSNRLKRGIPLQSDPTIIYGLPNFDGNLRKNDISNPHLYNTYVHPGLPPGPIANPGKEALAAALNPEKTDFIYFVSKNDGTHHFSKSLSEHLKAVRRYQVLKQ